MFLSSKEDLWVIRLGGFYSEKSANLLKEKAIELGFRSSNILIAPLKTDNTSESPNFLNTLEFGQYFVVVGTYNASKVQEANYRIDVLKKMRPKVGANKYKVRKGVEAGKWWVHIGGSYTQESANRLRELAINNGIVEPGNNNSIVRIKQ